MTPAETVTILRQFNEWRLCNDEDLTQLDPKQITEAIDAAIEMIERMREWIHEEGERNNICTYNILGEVCGYCECKRKGKVK